MNQSPDKDIQHKPTEELMGLLEWTCSQEIYNEIFRRLKFAEDNGVLES